MIQREGEFFAGCFNGIILSAVLWIALYLIVR